MGKKESGFGKILGCFPCSSSPSSPSSRPSCFSCINAMEPTSVHDSEEELERRPLVKSEGGRVMRLKDVLLSDDDDEHQTLAFQLKPKCIRRIQWKMYGCYGAERSSSTTDGGDNDHETVTLRVSMHCDGCARKVEKHISKMDGVTSYKVDLESKMVIVIGDVFPYEVLRSVSKVKNAELWSPREPTAPAMAIPTQIVYPSSLGESGDTHQKSTN